MEPQVSLDILEMFGRRMSRSAFCETKFIRLVLFSVLLAVAGGPIFSQEGAPPPAVVAVEAVTRDLAETSDFNGRLDANRRVTLVARVSGVVEEIGFAPGATITEGQTLFVIERDLYEATVREAQGALRAAEAQRDLARLERDRQAELVARETGAQARSIRPRRRSTSRRPMCCGSEATLDRARTNLSYTEIKAPFAGRIGDSAVDEARWWGPRPGRSRRWFSSIRSMPNSRCRQRSCAIFSNGSTAARSPGEAAVSLTLANGTSMTAGRHRFRGQPG